MEGSRDFIGRLDPPIRCCRQTLENFSIVCRRFPKKKEKKLEIHQDSSTAIYRARDSVLYNDGPAFAYI